MKVEVDRLTPGMILKYDVEGKSGYPLVEKETVLTNTHITILKKFLVEEVTIDSLPDISPHQQDKKTEIKENEKVTVEPVSSSLKQVVDDYKKLFISWMNNVPVDMYLVRQAFIPFFESIQKETLDTILSFNRVHDADAFYYRTVAQSALAVYLAQKMNFEKKDWLQIGFATVLSDSGLSKLTTNERALKTLPQDERWRLHPLHSYKMTEDVTTLTKAAKLAIIQHHEQIDGSGFPAKLKGNQIHPYARIIAITDVVFTYEKSDVSTIISNLEAKKGTKLDSNATSILINELTKINN